MKQWKIGLLHDGGDEVTAKGWCYFQQCRAMKRHAPPDFDPILARGDAPEFLECDCYLQLCYSHAEELRSQCYDAKIVTVLCTGWTDEGEREGRYWFERMAAVSDIVVFNNLLAWDAAGRPVRTVQISNGVDLGTFCPRKPIEGRTPRALFVGSSYHTDEANDVKGWGILRELKMRLEKRGLPCDCRAVDAHGELLSPDELAEWYSTGTVYCCTSRSEGTPNTLLEAMACGGVGVTARVGNVPEIIRDGVNGFIVERNVDAFEAGVLEAVEAYPRINIVAHEKALDLGWSRVCENYYRVFRRLLQDRG